MRPVPHTDAAAKFLDLVSIGAGGDCWRWMGSRNSRGYGQVSFMGRNRMAHRIAYELANGPIPRGLLVCHSCDNPLCVNPRHLWLGTHTDNMRDMYAKSRQNPARGDRHGLRLHPERAARGERHRSHTHPESIPRGRAVHGAVLWDGEVRQIRERARSGETHESIARAYGVTRPTVSLVVERKTWRHVV